MTNTPAASQRRRFTLTLDLDHDNANVHAADALLHLIQWFDKHAIAVEATLYIPGNGTLTATSRRAPA